MAVGFLQAPLRKTEPSHAMGEARRSKPHLGDLQAVAFIEQPLLNRNFEPFEGEFADTAMLFRSERLDAPHDPPSGVAAMKKKPRQAAPGIIRCARHQDEMRCRSGSRYEPFPSVDDIAVALSLRSRQHHAA